MIELLAAVVAVQTFREEIRGKLVLLFIDSEPVEAALIKGYSGKEDVCELVGLFWELVLELRCSVYIDRAPTALQEKPADMGGTPQTCAHLCMQASGVLEDCTAYTNPRHTRPREAELGPCQNPTHNTPT